MPQHEKPVIVFGAGPAGLGAAYWLAKAGRKVIVLEKEPRVGGMGASIRRKEYVLDYGPHTFHLKKSLVTDLFNRLVGADVYKVRRKAQIWLHGKTLPFPLGLKDALTKLSPFLAARIIFDYLYQHLIVRFVFRVRKEAMSFEEWGVREFGRTLYELAFGNYSEKMWGLPGKELSVKLAKQKLTGLSLIQLIFKMLGLLGKEKAEKIGLSEETLYDAYPRYGIGTFFEALKDEIISLGGRIELSCRIDSISISKGCATKVKYSKGDHICTEICGSVISSIPLTNLAPLLPARDYADAQRSSTNLRYRSLCVVHLVLDRDLFSDAHWIYLLDPQLYGNRVSEQKNLSKDSCPPGQTVLTVDITCDLNDYLWKADDSFLIALAMQDLSVMGLHPRTVLDAFVLRAANVYPIYSLGFEKEVDAILSNLQNCRNLLSIGRHGLLLNNDMHDSLEMGFFAAKTVLDGEDSSKWYAIAERYVLERLEGIVKDPIQFDQTKVEKSR